MPIYAPVPCRATKTAIQSAAEHYARRIGFNPGDSIIDLVEKLGGEVLYRDFFKVGAESIHVRASNDFDVYVPNDTSPTRDRFTIGHELGHLLLHYPMLQKLHPGQKVEMRARRYLPPDASEEERRAEWEANWFSAALIMPSDEFNQAWEASGGDLESVARDFLVSTLAAENRAKSLGLE